MYKGRADASLQHDINFEDGLEPKDFRGSTVNDAIALVKYTDIT